LLEFNRAVERSWIAACLCGTLCLAISSLSSLPSSRAALVDGYSLLAFGGLLYLTIPDRPHTIEASPLSDVSVLIYTVTALPVIVGAGLLVRGWTGRRPAETMPDGLEPPRRARAVLVAGGVVGLMAVAVAAVLFRLATTQRHATETTVSVGAHYAPV